MTTYLLDVNVLIALCDSRHIQHEAAHRWFARRGRASWATCPITENGFVRVASHPSYPSGPGDANSVMEILRQFVAVEGHVSWADEITLRDMLSPGVLITHAQITDAYLLGLAAHKGGKLATFDRRIPISAVRSGADKIELVPA